MPGLSAELHVRGDQLGELPHQAWGGAGQVKLSGSQASSIYRQLAELGSHDTQDSCKTSHKKFCLCYDHCPLRFKYAQFLWADKIYPCPFKLQCQWRLKCLWKSINYFRMGLLVTLFLVLINIFNSVRETAPISSRLNAIDLYLVVCIFLVFSK